MMKLKYTYIIIFLLLFSCSESSKKKAQTPQDTPSKSIRINDFAFAEFTEEAQKTMQEWWDFKALYQVLISIAPPKNPTQILKINNPDSLYVFKRIHINSPRNILNNVYLQRDWRTAQLPTDTIYQLYKERKEDWGALTWREVLLKDIPYTFSLFLRSSHIKNIDIRILWKEKKVLSEQSIRLDSLDKNNFDTQSKMTTLDDNWLKFETKITPIITGSYDISIYYDENQPNNEYLSLYRPQLLTPVKYQSEIENSSEKLIPKGTVIRSSYNGIYFWLLQVQEELRQVWVKNQFPQKIDIPEVRSRLRLFETYVDELSDNVKNNPHLTQQELILGIEKIQLSFAWLIEYINFVHQEDITKKMNKLAD